MDIEWGYKHTEAGLIPEDWESRQLSSISPILTGSTPPTRNPDNYGTEFLFVSPVDLGYVKNIVRTERMLSKKGYAISRHFPKGSILFVCIGSTIGKCGIASTELTSNQQINAILPSPDISNDYVYYAVLTVARKVKSLAGEQAVPLVNKRQFSSTEIPLPSTRDEQQAIADVLSDVDGLIESLDQTLAKKRQIKQGAMQELLTGRRHMPGFSGQWKTTRLGEIGESLIGLTYKPSEVRSHGTLVLRSSNVQNGTLRFDDNVFVEAEIPDRIMVREGDILICVRNGSRDLIGKCVKIGSEAEGMTFGAFMAVFRSAFHNFVYHQFQSDMMKRQIHEHLGATINQITNKSLNSFEIPMPPTEAEQQAVANVLTDMDREINALETRIAKARQIKQGMMQELLTGRIRLR
jgi:type I restriction enzyme, S subunit